MRNTKLWSVLLAVTLLCGCVLGILFTGASAEGAVTYGVNYTEGVDKSFQTIQEVFDDVEAVIAAGNWPEGQSLEILFTGSIEAKVENSELVFGQKTIFTSTGKKLPITIKGTEASKASTITVTADKIACANDYTFEDLTLDTWSSKTNFFAGSGQIVFKNLATATAAQAQVAYLFGDNYTAEAFEGWTKDDMQGLMDEDDTILTSLTFDSYLYNGYNSNDYYANIAAVGASYDEENQKDAYSAQASDDATFVIGPASTKAMIHWASGSPSESAPRLGGYWQKVSARVHTAIIKVTGGSVGSLAGDEASGQWGNKIVNGNVEIYAKDADATGTVRVFYGGGKGHNDMTNTADAPAGEYGNVTVYCENIKKGGSVYIDGSSNKTIPGKAKITLKKFHHNGKSAVKDMSSFEFLGIGALGGVENNLTQCKLTGFSGCRYESAPSSQIGDVVNNLTNVDYVGNSSKWNYNAVAMRNNGVGVKVKSITNNLTDCVIGSGSNAISFYGSRSSVVSGTIKNVLNNTDFNYAYYGSNYGSANRVENYYNAGSTFAAEIRGTNYGTVETVLNEVAGATVNHNLQGTYNTTVTDKVETTVTSGTLKALYVAYGGSTCPIGDIVNTIRDGTFTSDILLGGYGGTQIKSVTNNIYGGNFNNKDKLVACASGNHNWTAQVLGDVVNNFYGGTFAHAVYGGARGGCVQGNVYNNIKSGTFNGNFYGGNYGPTYYKADHSYYNDFLNKGIEGTIYNTIGEEGKPETAPTFGKSFYGGDMGVIADNAYANESNCSIENTVYGGTFTGTFYGGNAKDAYISKQISHAPYSITLNITNDVYGGTFKSSFFGGSASSAHVATEGSTIAAGVSGGTITNTLYSADITTEYLGGIGTGVAPLTLDVINNIYDVTMRATENYMGHGANREVNGTVTNTFYDGFTTDSAYVYGAGAGILNAPEGKKAVVNTIHGGSFDGFWGLGGNAAATVNGDAETTVYGGTFNTYDNGNLINGIAGGARNGTLNGDAVLNIYGGTFVGQVSGGTFLGSSDYKNRLVNGSTELNIYGGNFKRSIFACSPTATVTATGGSTLNITPTEGKELAFYATVNDITSFDASSDVVVTIGKNAFLGIDSLTGTLKVEQGQKWQARIYVTVSAANADIQYATAEGVLGSASLLQSDAATDLVGNGIEISSASLLISDRIQLKLMLDADEIAALPADFEFTFVTEDGTELATVNAENIGEAVDGYYNVILSALGLSEFDKTIVCEGNYLYRMEMTIISLADLGAKYYTETAPNATYAQLFRSIADLGRKANGEETVYELVTKAVNWTASKAPQALDERLSMKTKGLVMTDAIGIRLAGETVAFDTPLTFFVNGKDVTEYCVVTRSETADETSGKFGFTVDMYVNAAMMTKELDIQIEDDAQTALFTMTLRVDALAEQIAAATEAEGELSDYALAFIQAADAYVNAKEA